MTTQETLNRRLERLDAVRTLLLQQVEQLPVDTLTAHPIPGKWSILELVEHMVLAERYVLVNEPDPAQLIHRPRNLRQRALYPVVLFVLKVGIPVKAPSRKMLPGGQKTLAELRREWDASVQWLRNYVAGLTRKDYRKAVFIHPVAGPLTAGQVLLMGRIHVELHTRQIQRLIRLTSSVPLAPRPGIAEPPTLPR